MLIHYEQAELFPRREPDDALPNPLEMTISGIFAFFYGLTIEIMPGADGMIRISGLKGITRKQAENLIAWTRAHKQAILARLKAEQAEKAAGKRKMRMRQAERKQPEAA